MAVAQLQRGRQLAGARRTQPGQFGQRGRMRLQQRAQGTVGGEQSARGGDRVPAAQARSRGISPAVRHPTAPPAPRASSFSRGRSAAGQSRMCMDQLGRAACRGGIRARTGASGKLSCLFARRNFPTWQTQPQPLARPAHPAVRRRRHRRLQGAGTGAPAARCRGPGAGGDDRQRAAASSTPLSFQAVSGQPDPHHAVGQRGRGGDGPYRTGALGRPHRDRAGHRRPARQACAWLRRRPGHHPVPGDHRADHRSPRR